MEKVELAKRFVTWHPASERPSFACPSRGLARSMQEQNTKAGVIGETDPELQ